jgi:hypothetical protein
MPKSNYGRWSVWLVFAMFLLFFISSILASQIDRIEPDGENLNEYFIKTEIYKRLYNGGFVAGIAAFMNGLISIFDKKEHGILIYTATIFSAGCTLYFFGRLLFPH